MSLSLRLTRTTECDPISKQKTERKVGRGEEGRGDGVGREERALVWSFTDFARKKSLFFLSRSFFSSPDSFQYFLFITAWLSAVLSLMCPARGYDYTHLLSLGSVAKGFSPLRGFSFPSNRVSAVKVESKPDSQI